jgi:hypothetical protein
MPPSKPTVVMLGESPVDVVEEYALMNNHNLVSWGANNKNIVGDPTAKQRRTKPHIVLLGETPVDVVEPAAPLLMRRRRRKLLERTNTSPDLPPVEVHEDPRSPPPLVPPKDADKPTIVVPPSLPFIPPFLHSEDFSLMLRGSNAASYYAAPKTSPKESETMLPRKNPEAQQHHHHHQQQQHPSILLGSNDMASAIVSTGNMADVLAPLAVAIVIGLLWIGYKLDQKGAMAHRRFDHATTRQPPHRRPSDDSLKETSLKVVVDRKDTDEWGWILNA